MIDIHAHVLPDVDDGSDSLETSLEMLSQAAESGVTALVSTHHCNIPGEYDNYADALLEEAFQAFSDAVKRAEPGVELFRGMEVFATPELPELLDRGRVWTINGTAYFLTEFSFAENPYFCLDVLADCSAMGYQPIIAHPERYYFLQDDLDLAYELCTAGYGLQINKGSLLGRFGIRAEHTARLLLDHGLAACVASDAHGAVQRTTYMDEVRDLLISDYGESYMRLLLEENPQRILQGKELLGYEPIPFGYT